MSHTGAYVMFGGQHLAIVGRVKAWPWTLEHLREHGGQAHTRDRRLGVDPHVDIEVVYVPPAEDQSDTIAYTNALGVFEELGVQHHELDHAGEVGNRAAQLIQPPAG